MLSRRFEGLECLIWAALAAGGALLAGCGGLIFLEAGFGSLRLWSELLFLVELAAAMGWPGTLLVLCATMLTDRRWRTNVGIVGAVQNLFYVFLMTQYFIAGNASV